MAARNPRCGGKLSSAPPRSGRTRTALLKDHARARTSGAMAPESETIAPGSRRHLDRYSIAPSLNGDSGRASVIAAELKVVTCRSRAFSRAVACAESDLSDEVVTAGNGEMLAPASASSRSATSDPESAGGRRPVCAARPDPDAGRRLRYRLEMDTQFLNRRVAAQGFLVRGGWRPGFPPRAGRKAFSPRRQKRNGRFCVRR